MTVDNFLPKALFISLALHTGFVCSNFLAHIRDPQKKELVQKKVEISYEARPRKADVEQRPIKPAQKLDLSGASLLPQGAVAVKLNKQTQTLPGQLSVYERKPEKINNMRMSRRVSIVPIKSAKINNPVYAAYNEIVRSRIEEKVYENYDRMEQGRVYLTFIISSNGALKVAQIIKDKSQASGHLQEISLKSLQDAGPFPAFLKGMTLPEYTFNIEVQYRVQ